MNKKFNNGAIFSIAQVLFGEGTQDAGLVGKKNLKTRMAVRQALKFNYRIIADAYKNITEMVNEIQRETVLDYFSTKKAYENEQGIIISENYRAEFDKEITAKLNELTEQIIELNIHTIPEKEYLAWAEANDGELTDMELDIVEIFVDFEQSVTEEPVHEQIERVEGEIVE